MTAAALRTYVNCSENQMPYVESCWDEATALVLNYVGGATVPASVVERACLECGSELFHRKSAPNGITQFAGLDGAAIRVSRDPMIGAYAILRPFVGPGIA